MCQVGGGAECSCWPAKNTWQTEIAGIKVCARLVVERNAPAEEHLAEYTTILYKCN